MKKTTRYARKMRQRGQAIGIVNAAAWHNTIQRCQPFGERETYLPDLPNAAGGADTLLIEARDALNDMLHHSVAADNPQPYDCLARVIDVAFMRSLAIDSSHQTNPVYANLQAARTVLHSLRTRWERMHRWGLFGLEREPLARAVDHYETILLASSPEQMHAAEMARMEAVAKGCFFEPGAST